MKKIIIIILAVLIAGAGAAYYFIVVRGSADEAEEIELTAYVPGDYFVTNVRGGTKLFKVTIALMLDTEELTQLLSTKEYTIRDTVILRLRELTEEELQSEGIQDRLREELTQLLNSALGIDNIVTVYFSDFVMQ